MAVTSFLYGKLPANLTGGETAGESVAIDWLSDTIKVALLTSSYTPNQGTDEFFGTVDDYEVSGDGYDAGGLTLGSKTVAYDTRVTTFDAADVTWAASSITARYAVVYKVGADAASSPLILCQNFGADVVSAAGNFTITWNASGMFTVTVGAEA